MVTVSSVHEPSVTVCPESAERLRLALDAGGMGTFVWDAREDRSDADARMLELFGLPPDGSISHRDALERLVHPDDRERHAAAVERACDPDGDGAFLEEVRVVHPDGAERCLSIRGQVHFGGSPRRALWMAGVVMDVTERDRAERALHETEARRSFLLRLDDTLRPLEDPVEIEAAAARLVTEQLRSDRAYYAEVDVEQDRVVVHREHLRTEAPSLVGTYSFSAFRTVLDPCLRGEPFVRSGRPGGSSPVSADEEAALEALRIGGCLVAPVLKGDRLVAVLVTNDVAARDWTPPEVRMVRDVAERTWEAVERARAQRALGESEERYRTLFESIDEGFCIIEVLFGDDGAPEDYRFLEVNPAFEKHSGLHDAVGRRIREMVPDHEPSWFEIYGRVARTGESIRCEHRGDALPRNGWFDLYAFRIGAPGENRVAVLFSNITERKDAEAALREQDRRKDEFLAMLAHELRNPLAAIRNGVHILQRPGVPPSSVELAVGVLDRQTARVSRLVNDLLNVSRVSRGRIDLRRERVLLGTVLQEAVEDIRPRCEAVGQTLSVSVPEPLHLHADATRLVQVVENLLDNACKFTPRGGRILLAVEREGDEAVLRVRDDGIGIAAEELPRVFDTFTQVDASPRRAEQGLGLGLTLVRYLVEMHGGTVEAHSDGLGHGSEFVVRLPLEGPEAGAAGA